MSEQASEWHGANPLYLILVLSEGEVLVDLDQRGWIASLGERMREPGTWHLCSKEGFPDAVSVAFSMAVLPGEQPYYVARHIGRVPGGEVVCYGIGKRRLDGHTDRGWVLPNGQVCIGDDVETFARGMIRGG